MILTPANPHELKQQRALLIKGLICLDLHKLYNNSMHGNENDLLVWCRGLSFKIAVADLQKEREWIQIYSYGNQKHEMENITVCCIRTINFPQNTLATSNNSDFGVSFRQRWWTFTVQHLNQYPKICFKKLSPEISSLEVAADC